MHIFYSFYAYYVVPIISRQMLMQYWQTRRLHLLAKTIFSQRFEGKIWRRVTVRSALLWAHSQERTSRSALSGAHSQERTLMSALSGAHSQERTEAEIFALWFKTVWIWDIKYRTFPQVRSKRAGEQMSERRRASEVSSAEQANEQADGHGLHHFCPNKRVF